MDDETAAQELSDLINRQPDPYARAYAERLEVTGSLQAGEEIHINGVRFVARGPPRARGGIWRRVLRRLASLWKAG